MNRSARTPARLLGSVAIVAGLALSNMPAGGPARAQAPELAPAPAPAPRPRRRRRRRRFLRPPATSPFQASGIRGGGPERPDLSRVTLIRFLTEIDYPPFNYAGPDGKPAGLQRRSRAHDLRGAEDRLHDPDAAVRYIARFARRKSRRCRNGVDRGDAARRASVSISAIPTTARRHASRHGARSR